MKLTDELIETMSNSLRKWLTEAKAKNKDVSLEMSRGTKPGPPVTDDKGEKWGTNELDGSLHLSLYVPPDR